MSDAFVESIGVNTHLNFPNTAYQDYPLVKSKLSALGVRHARDHAYLDETPRDQILYDKYKDLASRGVRFNLVFQPGWKNFGTISREDVAAVKGMAGPSVEAFEGPNEYDFSGNSNWAGFLRDYQQDLYEAVKGNASTADVPVLAPSLARSWNAGELGNLSAHLDYGNMHSYPGGQRPSAEVLSDYHIPNAKKVSGTKPIIATETGYHNALRWTQDHPSVSERAAGRYVPRTYLEYFNRGVKRTYIYSLIDEYPDPENDEREKNFGLLRHNGAEKPSYTALKNLIALLKDPGGPFETGALDYTLSGETSGLHRTLLQKRDGRFYLVLWVEKSSYDIAAQRDIYVPDQQVSLSLGTQITEARTYLPNRSSLPIEQYNDPSRITLQVPDHPLVVELTSSGNTAPRIIDPTPTPRKRISDRTPIVSAAVTDKETDLDASDITLLINGRRREGFSYDPSTDVLKFTPSRGLERGAKHQVTVIARDDNGLSTTRRWRFEVRRLGAG